MRALLGVSDKRGLVEFSAGLASLGVELVATEGTRAALAAAGIEARAVSELTGMPEMLDGRVKTLHPAIFAGILARRDRPEHMQQLGAHGFVPIDIVAVSLYPFEETVARGASPTDIVEQIDIGGPSLVRAAAKNGDSVTVVVSPHRYEEVLSELRAEGSVSERTRRVLAAEAFAHVAAYDTAIAWHLASQQAPSLPPFFSVGGERLHELRYGENPHQQGGLYATPGAPTGVARARQLQGPPLSFTNWLDLDAAHRIVADFEEPAAVIIKHTNPCGFGVGRSAASAYTAAFECDPRSAFGGVVGFNRALDDAAAAEVTKTFIEAVVCPGADDAARERFLAKDRLRLMLADQARAASAAWDVRSISGGLLVQTADRVTTERSGMRVVSETTPDEQCWRDLLAAWRLCRHVKSNAIVIVRKGAGVGVGAGQMSRVEAAELAVERAGERARGAVAASDAFFPMPDGLETLARAGVRAVIQPGGSRKDPEVIAAADGAGVAMVFTGERHFRH